ncbi:MAG: SpoIIE family protein phosphatase [Firmicutes bacterium]|nr:SpoIIE family protein phosphatase [Bacillota bacterium]
MAKNVSIFLRANEDELNLGQLVNGWALSPLAWSVIGFLLGRSAIFGEIWPFGLAFLVTWRTAKRSQLVLPLVGVVAGLTSAIGIRLALPYYAAFALIALFPGEDEKIGKNWLLCGSLLLKVILHYLLQPIPMVFIVAITECAFAVFSYGLMNSVVERCLEKQLAHRELYAFFVAVTLIIACPWSWGGISLRLFLVCALLVLGARLGGLGVSCILGPSLALLMLLLGEPTPLVLLIVIASLLTGFLHRFRWGYYVGPGLAWVFCVPGPVEVETLQWMLVVLGASWVASRVPQERLTLLARIVPGTQPFMEQDKGHDEHLKKVLDQKIDGYLTVFEELERTLLDNENPLFHKQMHGMAELLKTMKNSFSPEARFTKEFEEKLLRHFARADLSHITALQCLDGFEIYGARRKPCGTGTFCQEVADFCSGTISSQRFGVTNTGCSTGGTCGFHISPCPSYRVEIGKAKVASQEVSGDSQTTFEISPSKVAIVLSDGMGVGLKAHTESNVTLRLLERMIKAGYDLRTAVSLINRLLMLRNQDDMFVTIDMVVVDLFSGQLEFVKVGAAPSFIKRGREVEIIHNQSLPVGVLDEVDVQSDRRTLKEGEILVMTTDGVLDAQRSVARKDEWMCWNLRRLQCSGDMAAMAEEILYDSIEIADGRVDDDMMVVVARIVPVDWGIETYRRVQSSVL